MDTIRYIGPERANSERHDGGLAPAVGAQTWQVMRADRENPAQANGYGWTYNHAPMLTYWHGRFLLHYLSNPVGEHEPPGRTWLVTSENGRDWSEPTLLFPEYRLPPGVGPNKSGQAEDCVMHQRMGFYEASGDKLLALGFYGVSPDRAVVPFDQNGLGRVVREIREDGGFGEIYFIHYNSQTGFDGQGAPYLYYTANPDKAFVEACEEMLANPLVTQQWAEEHGDSDERITVKGKPKAFCCYTLPDGRTAALWKWAKVGISRDKGRSYEMLGLSPSLRMAGGKIWGQKTADGNYAHVYNPSTDNKHRWPLAVTTSEDGLAFSGMRCLCGEAPPRRYAGAYKDWGQNYVRGVSEWNTQPPDGRMWVAYSMNKEDIFVTSVPVPIRGEAEGGVREDFAALPENGAPENWNCYSTLLSPVRIRQVEGTKALCLTDGDPRDYAKAERVFKERGKVSAEISVLAQNAAEGSLFMELCSRDGLIPARVILQNGVFTIHHGRRVEKFAACEENRRYTVRLTADCENALFQVDLDGVPLGKNQSYQGQDSETDGFFFLNDVPSLGRLTLRTGPVRRSPSIDEPIDLPGDLPPRAPKPNPARFAVFGVEIR